MSPRSKNLFLQTIVKPEHHSESLSLPINVSIMIIEVQWACSLLSQILGLDNDKFVVEVMLGFLLTFFMSEFSRSVCISFDKFIVDNMHQQLFWQKAEMGNKACTKKNDS
jgi:hypothetical protein